MLWYAARAAALAAFFVLAASLLTGMAIRTALLAPVARNRAVVAVHGFLTWFWLPLVAVHVTSLLLDATSRITPLDLLVPFRVNEGAGSQLAIGMGTIGLLLLVADRRHIGAAALDATRPLALDPSAHLPDVRGVPDPRTAGRN